MNRGLGEIREPIKWKSGKSGKWEQIWEVIARADFYFECDGKPLESVELKSAMIQLFFFFFLVRISLATVQGLDSRGAVRD